jgi:hypothetical protein
MPACVGTVSKRHILERNYKRDIRFIDKEIARMRHCAGGVKAEKYINELIVARQRAQRQQAKQEFESVGDWINEPKQ